MDLNETSDVVEDTKKALAAELAAEYSDVTDSVGCGAAKLEIFVVSDQFEGKTLVKRHQMVQAAVRSIKGYEERVHAITIKKALTSQQYKDFLAAAAK